MSANTSCLSAVSWSQKKQCLTPIYAIEFTVDTGSYCSFLYERYCIFQKVCFLSFNFLQELYHWIGNLSGYIDCNLDKLHFILNFLLRLGCTSVWTMANLAQWNAVSPVTNTIIMTRLWSSGPFIIYQIHCRAWYYYRYLSCQC